VPSVCRRIVVLLVVALVGVGGPVTSAFAQGAGDQQYQDPFGDSGSGSSGSGSSGSGSSGSSGSGSSGSSDGNLDPLSPAPQTSGSGTSGSGTSSGTAGTSGTGATTSPAASGTLPNTGLDTRVLLLAGAVLLLVGVGLRMRNAPERF
jgi:LPXTG-motif cell wall-anchored protein